MIDNDKDYSLNDVVLRGWITTPAFEHELPSGDVITKFRIAITRPEGGVDTIDVEAWDKPQKKISLDLKDGEWVEINGSIRRRFWKADSGLASRWQVIAHALSRIEE